MRTGFRVVLSAAVFLFTFACTKDTPPPAPGTPAAPGAPTAPNAPGAPAGPSANAGSPTRWMDAATAGQPLYAIMQTSMGNIELELDSKNAPLSVANFVGLASAEKEWTNAQGQKVKTNFYDGLTFHRVIPGFMDQGGDPLGTGMGGPGFTIPDEYPKQKGLQFTKGTLGMARTGAPNSGGSQFFICVADSHNLDGQYTVFGHVTSGQDVADRISQVAKDANNKPNVPVVIKRVIISDHK